MKKSSNNDKQLAFYFMDNNISHGQEIVCRNDGDDVIKEHNSTVVSIKNRLAAKERKESTRIYRNILSEIQHLLE